MMQNKTLIAFLTLVRKELARTFRIWPQTLVPPAITMALYFLIFGKLIGSQIQPVAGLTYMQYIVPGLVMMSVITNSYVNSSSSFFGMKFQRSIEEILVSPMPNYVILLGFIAGSLLRAVLVAFIVILIAMAFTHVTIHHFIGAAIIVIVTSFFFATAGVVNAIFARNFDDVSWIPSFVLTPLTYLGGVFFSIQMLSPLWQKIALLDPVYYIIDIFRYAMLGVHDTNIMMSSLILVLLSAGLYLYALFLLRTSHRLRS